MGGVAQARPYRSLADKLLVFFDGILDRIPCIFDDLFGIPKPLFRLASDLIVRTLRLLVLVSNQFTGFLLNFAGDIFDNALDLVFIHNYFSYG